MGLGPSDGYHGEFWLDGSAGCEDDGARGCFHRFGLVFRREGGLKVVSVLDRRFFVENHPPANLEDVGTSGSELEAVRAKLEAMEFERVAALKDVAAMEEKGKRMFDFRGKVIRRASHAVRCALSKEYNGIVN
ncbi:hypothetical protein Bca4012_025893 [Brassica carinata]|uniref:Uncharacterized protein n=1 Tax=Brassica carinata TaxID=52824 RepID=A0A8X8ARZ1_BRACI|nr:hypothetical protein Bca52824_022921 [Brassica carinata]